MLYATVSAGFNIPALSSQTRALVSLSPEERAAMQWVKGSAPPSASFLVVPESQWGAWHTDKTQEWFPTLTGRFSLATVQGAEWLPNQTFARMRKSYKDLQECAGGTIRCLDEWADKGGKKYTHVYIAQPTLPEKDSHLLCCKLLIRSLQDDSRFEMIYPGPGAVIFAKR
jgi:hypothetical protein